MDIYARKSYWKWYLAAGGAVIVIISLIYTKYLADRLADREDQQARLFSEALLRINKLPADTTAMSVDLSLHTMVLTQNTTIPVVIIDESGRIEDARNIEGVEGDKVDTARVRQKINSIIAAGTADTILVVFPPDIYKKVIYTHSRLLSLLNWYPYVQLFLISVFIAFGYLGFSASRRAEENQVWLGMAKETAHQLGTPISAILGWIEALKSVNEDHGANLEMLHELNNDVVRLELVADRFSKIGSLPELKAVNLYDELDKCRAYMQRRSPRRTSFEFPDPADHPPVMVLMNPHLFDWVIENLLRNAIDAMEGGAGLISAQIYEENGFASIDVSDTGKGIPTNRFNKVFKPGYSTKTRGWGLGLSLSKRIIDQYHRGKLFVKKSEPGKGTTFTIRLQKAGKGKN